MLQLFQYFNALTVKLDKGQACLIDYVQEMKNKQAWIETKISPIRIRLYGFKWIFDNTREATQDLMDTHIKENRKLHKLLYDTEYPSRRSNGICHSIEHSAW